MQPFTYTRSTTLADATARGSADGAMFVAGGTTLVDLMKLDVERPSTLVDINTLPLDTIEAAADGSLRVGAMVRNSVLAHDERVVAGYPALSQAILSGASAQLRNMATTGGNLLQRTRCYYFRDPVYPCNKREPGSGCAALDGYNRIHAVLGGSDACIATHPSDMAVALVALDASVHVMGAGGERVVPIVDFHVLPGTTPHIESVLARGEVVTHVTLPARPFAAQSAYVKLRDRASFEFALASAAAACAVEGHTIADARLALGGVATRPWRAADAEQLLVGATVRDGRPDDRVLRAAADAALSDAVPRRHNAYKIELAKRAIARAVVLTLAGRGGRS